MKKSVKILTFLLSILTLSSCKKPTPSPTPTPVKEMVTVTLDPNGGSISKTNVTVTKGTAYYNGLFPTPKKDHYTFSYWTYEDGEDIKIESTYSIIRDVTLKAQYVNNITVSFNTDGGTALSPVEIASGTLYKASLFKTPSKDGYNFSHWVIDDTGELLDAYRFDSDITLKAIYTEQPISEDQKYINSLNISNVGCPYLYESTFNEVDYKVGSKYFGYTFTDPNLLHLGRMGCSSVSYNGFYGRNFDLSYSKDPEFIVKTNYSDGKYNSIGVSYMPSFTNISEIGTTKNITLHKVIPFMVVDGINEHGLTICINEVPSMDSEVGRCQGTDTSKPNMSSIMMVRYLLDYAKDIDDAKEKVKNYNFISLNYYNEIHYLIADATGKSAVIEFKKKSDGSGLSDIVFYESNDDPSNPFKGVMTNFSFNGYKGDAEDYYKNKETVSLTLHAEGVERYNLLMKKLYNDGYVVNSLDTMLKLMEEVYYTKAYTIPLTKDSDEFWYTDYNYVDRNTIKSDHTVERYSSLYEGYRKNFHNWNGTEVRNGSFYCARHSVAYDIKNLEMKIVFEETNKLDKVYKISKSQ